MMKDHFDAVKGLVIAAGDMHVYSSVQVTWSSLICVSRTRFRLITTKTSINQANNALALDLYWARGAGFRD